MKNLIPLLFLSSALAADPAILKSEFIYDTGPYPQIHATTIVETPSGMVSAWFGGTAETNPDVCIWVSRVVYGKWPDSVDTSHGVQPAGTRHPKWHRVLLQPKNALVMRSHKLRH